MRLSRSVLTSLVIVGFASVALGQYTFPSFNQTVPNTPIGSIPLPVGGMPAGNYTSYSVSVDWTAVSGDPWSNEAIWALADNDINAPPGVFYADPGAAPNSGSNGNPVTLQWNGYLTAPYSGGSTLYWLNRQTFTGSVAQWNNITITLGFDTPTAPAAIDLGALSPGMTMQTGNLAPGQVIWYKFTVPAVSAAFNEFLTIDTFGSTLIGGTFGDGNDSEIGLYNSFGALMGTNDDANSPPALLLSYMNYGASQSGPVAPISDLAAGTYYLAFGGFNTTFGPAFAATSTSPVNGQYKVTFNTNVPEPMTLSLLGVAALLGIRRSRR